MKLKTFILQALGYTGIEAVSKGSNIALSIALAAILTVSDYGLVSILIVLELILTELIVLGQNVAVLRFYGGSEPKPFHYKYSAARNIVFFMTLAVVIFAGIFQLDQFFISSTRIATQDLVMLIIAIGIQTQIVLYLSYLRAAERIGQYGRYRVLSQVLRFVMILGLVLALKTPSTYVEGTFISSLIVYMVILLNWKKNPDLATGDSEKKTRSAIVENLKFGIPLAVHAIAGAMHATVDRVILTKYLDHESVAVYNFAIVQGGSIFFIVNILALVFIPHFYKQPVLGKLGLRYLYLFLAAALLGTIIAGLIVYYFVFPLTLKYVPEEYAAGKVVLLVAMLTVMAQCFSSFGAYKLTALNSPKYIAVCTVLSLVVNIVLNVTLIPEYGYIGAAWSSLASEALYAVAVISIGHWVMKRSLAR